MATITVRVPLKGYSHTSPVDDVVVDNCLFWRLNDDTTVKLCNGRSELLELIERVQSLADELPE